MSPRVSLHLSPVVSPPGCLARLSGWTCSFVSLASLVSLCLPSFVSRCLPAWMIQSGWTGSFVSLCHLSPVVSQPGCLARLSGWTGSFVSLCLPSFVSQPGCLVRLGFICLPLSPFICLPLSPSLDAWVDRFTWLSGWTGSCVSLCPLHLFPVLSQPGCLARLWPWLRSFLVLWMLGTGSSSALHLDFDFAWARGGSSSLSIVGYTLSVRSVPRHQLRSRADDSGALRCAASATRRLCYPPGETNVNHAGVKSSIDSSRMFNEPYAEIPSGALGTWGCPGSPGGRVHLSPSPSICLTDSFVSLCLPLFGPGCLPAWTPVSRLSGVEGFICLPLSPFICLPLSPSLDAWHGSLGGRVHLSPFVSLHLSPVASQPGCLARLSGWTGSFVFLCLPSFVWHGSLGFVSLHLSPVVSQPGCLARLSGQIHLSPFVSLHLSPVVSQPGCLARLFGWTVSLVSLCLPSFGSPCLPAVTALQADGFTLVPLHLSISVVGRIDLSPFVSLYLSPVVSQPGCLSG